MGYSVQSMRLAAIIEKLRGPLSSPIETEALLLWLLVNTRKALDCEPGIAGFSTLRFHCDWMVHPALSGSGAAKLIGHVDEYQDVIDATMEENPALVSAAAFKALGELDDLIYFRRFRSELRAFLQRHQLPEDAIADDRWPEFLKIYISAVQSSPLEYKAPKQKGNAPPVPPDVQRVTVSLLDYKPAGAGSDFRLTWVWDWPNGDPDLPIGVRRVLFM